MSCTQRYQLNQLHLQHCKIRCGEERKETIWEGKRTFTEFSFYKLPSLFSGSNLSVKPTKNAINLLQKAEETTQNLYTMICNRQRNSPSLMGPLTMLSGSNSSWDRNTLRRFRETLACMEKGRRTIYTLLVTFKRSLFCATHTLYRYYAVLIPPWIHCIVAWIVIKLSFPNPQEIWVMSGTPIHHNWDYFTRTALNTQELQGPFQRWPNFPSGHSLCRGM